MKTCSEFDLQYMYFGIHRDRVSEVTGRGEIFYKKQKLNYTHVYKLLENCGYIFVLCVNKYIIPAKWMDTARNFCSPVSWTLQLAIHTQPLTKTEVWLTARAISTSAKQARGELKAWGLAAGVTTKAAAVFHDPKVRFPDTVSRCLAVLNSTAAPLQ